MIFGNSGSGKSTLAKKLANLDDLAHLDLDSLAWELTVPPKRKALDLSKQEIIKFTTSNKNWAIEGCYTDLLKIVEPLSNEIIFMNLPIAACIKNAKSRPWEPHKYESKKAQDANLDMLIDWIGQYQKRTDTFSESAHTTFYKQYVGKKTMFTTNAENGS